MNLHLHKKLFLLFFVVSAGLFAQPFFQRDNSVPVFENNIQQANPWAGGLNWAQFSAIDLNMDGIKDLVVFDRTGDKLYTFINSGTPNKVDYKYDPQYAALFPKLNNWVLLADYNCDGKEDIFSSASGGIKVYKNTSTVSGGLSFTLVSKLLYTNYPSNPNLNLYVSSVDIPAIADVDGDGDLDVLTFQIAGTQVEYHKNKSKELYGTCDSLVFDVATECWGNFSDDPNNCRAALHSPCPFKTIVKPDTAFHAHTGSTLLALDLNCDNNLELVVGNVSCNHMYMVTNGGDKTYANGTAIDSLFPAHNSNTTGIDLTVFPEAYYLDVDNDGLKDLLASPNAAYGSENFNSVWWYKNSGSNCGPVFTLQQKNFLQDQMIEVGEGAYPVFFDYNVDGRQDLLVGNYGYFETTGLKSQVSLYENNGTSTNPQFKLVTRDYANLGSYNLLNTSVSFGDLDGDGDNDMMVGDYDGYLYYFENTAGPSNTANFVLKQSKYADSANVIIDVGQYAAPQIIDVNRDGKKDLVIGNRSGKVFYYQNIGTPAAPVFAKRSAAFGGVNVVKKPYFTGYATPFMFDYLGAYKMLVGSETGFLYLYDHIDNNLKGNFHLVDSMYMNVKEGSRTAPCGTDLNNDGFMDFVVGNYCGGVGYFKGVSSNPIGIRSFNKPRMGVLLYPNPAAGNVTVQLNASMQMPEANSALSIFNLLGEEVYATNFSGSSLLLDVSNYKAGIYFCRITNGNYYTVKKLQVLQE